jgi:hypothetical protein
MTALLTGKNIEQPNLVAAIRAAISALVDRDRDKSGLARLLLTANCVSFILLCLIVFSRQTPVVMFRYDGTLLLSTAKNQARWMGDGLSYTMNFLEGNGGLWWAQIDTKFDPAFILASIIADDKWMPVVAFTVYASEFFLTTILLGISLGLRNYVVVFGAWLGSLIAFPFFVPTLATDLIWGNPHILMVIALLSVAASLLLRIGRGSLISSLLGALGLILIGAFILFAFAGAAIQPIPASIIFATACVCASRSNRERWMKVAALVSVSAILALLFGRFLVGLYINTKGAVFPGEMWASPLGPRNISHLLAPGGRVMGLLLWVSALCGALLIALFGEREPRAFAIGLLVASGSVALLVAAIHLSIGDWWGPNPAYIDIYCFAFLSLFGSALVCLAFQVVVIIRRGASLQIFARRLGANHLSLMALAVLPWACLAWAQPPYCNEAVRNANPWSWPPHPTALTEFLHREIGLQAGAPFRGRLASLAGSTFDSSLLVSPFLSQHNYDQITLVDTGNDHRLYGLWYFGIPTLIENNQFSSPFFHLLTTRLLTEGRILSTHSQTALAKFDARVLEAVGVRYVLTDAANNLGFPLRLHLKLDSYRSQYLYELPQPNLGNYSPIQIHTVTDATSAVRLMADPTFDFTKEVVLAEPLPDAHWVPATKSTITVFPDHLGVEAESDGRSIVVLPIEYSHCLQFMLRSSAPAPVEVRRANLEQTAIAFSRSVIGSITLRYGPFEHPGCRLADYQDSKELALSAVPRTK